MEMALFSNLAAAVAPAEISVASRLAGLSVNGNSCAGASNALGRKENAKTAG